MGLFGTRKTRKFGEIAVNKGLISEKDVQEALKIRKEYQEIHKIHKKIGAILTEKGLIGPDEVKIILEEQKRDVSLMAWFYAFFGLSR